jgi:hypothetical protein
MDNEEYTQPTRTARITGILLMVVGVISLFLIEPVSSWYVETLDSIHDVDLSRRILVLSSMVPSILFASLTSWLITLGHRTITLKQWPPQGLPILYRTRKQQGRLADINGMVCFIAAGFTGLIALFWFYMVWKSSTI